MRLNVKTYLYLIVIVGFVLRIFGLINISLGGDFEYHWSVAGSIVGGGNLPVLGPSASINSEFHLGPFYYYLLAIPYLLGAGNFKIAVIFFSLISSLSIILLYEVSRYWFSEIQSLKIASLYAFSSYMITIGNFPWNAYLVPSFVILNLYFLVKIRKIQYRYLVPLGITYALALQAHATTFFLAPFIFLQIPFKKIKLSYFIISFTLFFLTLSPWLIAQYQQNFFQFRQVGSTLFGQHNQDCSFTWWLANHGHGERCFHYLRNTLFVFRLFSVSLFTVSNISTVLLVAVLSLYALLSAKLQQKRSFIFWLVSVLLLYLFYSANIYLHYMLILIPLPFFVFILFLQKIEGIPGFGKQVSNVILILTLINNLMHFFISLGAGRS